MKNDECRMKNKKASMNLKWLCACLFLIYIDVIKAGFA